MVERDFATDGKMKPLPEEERKKLKGFLPFYSVDTKEEKNAVINLAIRRGEFIQHADGSLIEATLYREQTLENLYLAGERLEALRAEWESTREMEK